MPKKIEWKRKIDQIELNDWRMKIICKDGTVYIGKSIGNCLGTDKNGEDVDGVRFKTDSGQRIDFIEDDIEKVEFLE